MLPLVDRLAGDAEQGGEVGSRQAQFLALRREPRGAEAARRARRSLVIVLGAGGRAAATALADALELALELVDAAAQCGDVRPVLRGCFLEVPGLGAHF